jgi:hypothetical protein
LLQSYRKAYLRIAFVSDEDEPQVFARGEVKYRWMDWLVKHDYISEVQHRKLVSMLRRGEADADAETDETTTSTDL